VVTERTMTVESAGAPQNLSAPEQEVYDARQANRAIQKMANHFRGANRGAQQKLDDCAQKCQS
jgi:hypothetical protein